MPFQVERHLRSCSKVGDFTPLLLCKAVNRGLPETYPMTLPGRTKSTTSHRLAKPGIFQATGPTSQPGLIRLLAGAARAGQHLQDAQSRAQRLPRSALA